MTSQSMETDGELWKRYRDDNDQHAFRLLIERYRERLLAYLIRLTGDDDQSFDLLQKTLVNFARGFDPDRCSSAKSFLFRIAVNEARSHYRRVKAKQPISLNALEDAGAEFSQDGDYYLNEMRARLIQSALNRLNVRDREVIELKDVEGFSYKSSADILGCSEKRFEKKTITSKKTFKTSDFEKP